MQVDRNGIIILYKPAGWTSFDVIAKARGILATRKVGHSGTLDPMATGVLPIFMGRATKAVDMLPVKDKEYVAVFRLGLVTDTGDITGEVIEQHPVDIQPGQLENRLSDFTGDILQTPPMYSALKVNGQPLYKLARQGVEVQRKPRPVSIKSIELLKDDSLGENEYKIKVLCSEGTYIRVLAEDIGSKLGCGATLVSLERTMACGYTIDQVVTLQQLQQHRDNDDIDSVVMPTDSVFMSLPRIDLSEELAIRLLNGAKSSISKPDGDYRVYHKDVFYAVANITDKKIRPVKLFTDKERESQR